MKRCANPFCQAPLGRNVCVVKLKSPVLGSGSRKTIVKVCKACSKLPVQELIRDLAREPFGADIPVSTFGERRKMSAYDKARLQQEAGP